MQNDFVFDPFVAEFFTKNPVIRSTDDIPVYVQCQEIDDIHQYTTLTHDRRINGVPTNLSTFLDSPPEEQARACYMDYRIGTTLWEHELYSGIKYFMDRECLFETQEDCINIISHIAHLLVIIPTDKPDLRRRFTKMYNRYIDNARKKFNISPTTPCDKGDAI